MDRKNAREDGEKPWTWAVPEGGNSGDVAGSSDGAEGDGTPGEAPPRKDGGKADREDPVEG